MTAGDSEGPPPSPKPEQKPVAPPQAQRPQEEEKARIEKLRDLKKDLEEEKEPPTKTKPEPAERTEDEAKFTELLDKQRRLMREVIASGQSLMEAWTTGWGMGLIKPTDSPLENDRQSLPSHWKTTASGVLSADALSFRQNLSQDGIYETVVIKPVTLDVIAKRQTTKRVEGKGLFGRFKYVDKKVDENYVVDQKPATMRDAANVDSDEPAAAVYYEAYDAGDRTLPIAESYRDGFGRPGNSLNLKVVIPQNLSEQVSAAIREDPGFPRKLVYRLVRQKYPQQFVSETWNTFGAPPYNSWDRHTRPKLLFLDMQTEPELNKTPSKLPNYDTSHVIQYTTKVVNGSAFGIPDAAPA